jgi:hypothetical protein
VLSLPDGADTQKIREVLGPDCEDAVYLVSLTWESLGVLVFRRQMTLDLVDDFWWVNSPVGAKAAGLFRGMASHAKAGDGQQVV